MNRRTAIKRIALLFATPVAAAVVPLTNISPSLAATILKTKALLDAQPIPTPRILITGFETIFDPAEGRWFTRLDATLQDGKDYVAVDYHDEKDEAYDVYRELLQPAMQRRIEYIDDPDSHPIIKDYDDAYRERSGEGWINVPDS